MRSSLVIGCLLAAVGCGGNPEASPLETGSAKHALAATGFTFLEPLAAATGGSGTFAGAVRPTVRVEDANGNVVLDDVSVREQYSAEVYRVNWQTDSSLTPGTYRIVVEVPSGDLGIIDVELRSGAVGGEIEIGSTVPVRFHVATTAVDADADGDYDWLDNCPNDANADQLDTDGDGQGDACEPRAVRITAPGEAYGHHSDAEDACNSNWNGCGDAETCALWACLINGYPGLVSYGDAAGCTQFTTCNLIFDGPNNGAQMNWGAWCDVMGVTDIDCEPLP